MRGLPLAVLLLALGGGCHKDPPLPSLGATLPVEGPVPAPDGLLAELVAPTPDAAWGKIQRGIGGAIALFPMTSGGVICSLVGIDPSLGPEIDGASPIYGALADDHGDLAYALAVKLIEPRRARTLLVEAEGARYAAKEEGSLTVLSPKGGGKGAAMALARGGFFLIARNATDLARLGPYVHRTLPMRPLPASSLTVDVPRAALSGVLKSRLVDGWNEFRAEKERQDAQMRQAHGGRAPDFADPIGIVGIIDGLVQTQLAIFGDLERAQLALVVGDADLKADLTLVPMAGNGAASALAAAMHPGDARSILEAPASSLVAVAWHGHRPEDTRGFEEGVAKAFGERLGAADKAKLHTAVADWSGGEGEDLLGWVAYGKHKGVVLHTVAADPEMAMRAIREGAELFNAPAFRAPLRSFLRIEGMTFGTSEVIGIGKVNLATFAPEAARPKALDTKSKPEIPTKAGVAWVARGKSVDVAFSDDPSAMLAAAAVDAKERLGGDPLLSNAVGTLGTGATVTIVAQPLTLDRAGASAPLVIGWGKRGADLWLHVDLSDLIVREVVKRAGGF